jgi:hypothetical protein
VLIMCRYQFEGCTLQASRFKSVEFPLKASFD